MLAAAFERLRVSEKDVQGSTSQSSTGITMNDTCAVLNLPQATPPDPKNVPVPDSGSEHGEEGEAAPYEVQGEVQDEGAEEEEEDDYKFYNPSEDV
eukprot:2685309-Amphidinium_carterae.1